MKKLSLILVIVLAICFSGCYTQKMQELNTRLAALEKEVQVEKKKVRNLAYAAVITSTFSVFDDPLDQFFGAPEFWENYFPDHEYCAKVCNNDRLADETKCHNKYPPGIDLDTCLSQASKNATRCLLGCGVDLY